MDLSTIGLIGLAVILLVIAGIAAALHFRKHVPKDQLASQVKLVMGDAADAMRDRVSESVRNYLNENIATLKSAYFDVDNFHQDIGRLPVSYRSAITLTTYDADRVASKKVVRDGDDPVYDYYLHPNGNVMKTPPQFPAMATPTA